MTSQFMTTVVQHESGFRAWHYHHHVMGSTSILLDTGSAELRAVLDADQISMVLELHWDGSDLLNIRSWHVATGEQDQRRVRSALLSILDIVFSTHQELRAIIVNHEIDRLMDGAMLRGRILTRQTFYQWPELWLAAGVAYPRPVEWVMSEHASHPLRPPQPDGEFYRRYVPTLNKVLSFKTVDVTRDLDRFHDWMNHPRIAPAWELGLPKPELEKYLLERQSDPHIFSVFGYFDDEPFGYFELYWTLEDRLGPYYQAQDFDRGIHLLVGNPAYLGAQYFAAWFTGLTHFLFLDDPRTMNVMGEPRADNKSILKHLQTVPSFQVVKEFDFPHKRAALAECTRARFFDLVKLP